MAYKSGSVSMCIKYWALNDLGAPCDPEQDRYYRYWLRLSCYKPASQLVRATLMNKLPNITHNYKDHFEQDRDILYPRDETFHILLLPYFVLVNRLTIATSKVKDEAAPPWYALISTACLIQGRKMLQQPKGHPSLCFTPSQEQRGLVVGRGGGLFAGTEVCWVDAFLQLLPPAFSWTEKNPALHAGTLLHCILPPVQSCSVAKGKATGNTRRRKGIYKQCSMISYFSPTKETNRCKEPSQQATTNLLRAGVAHGCNLPPVPLMTATRGQVLHTAHKNTLICLQALGSHRNNMEKVNATACAKEHHLNQTATLPFPECTFLATTTESLFVKTFMRVRTVRIPTPF